MGGQVAGTRGGESFEEFADGVNGFQGVAEAEVGVDGVVVPLPDARAVEVPAVGEVVEDSLYRSLGDPDEIDDVPLAKVGVAVESEQDVAVVGEGRSAAAGLGALDSGAADHDGRGSLRIGGHRAVRAEARATAGTGRSSLATAAHSGPRKRAIGAQARRLPGSV